MPPISHLLSTSHPPLATKAESAKSSRPNKKIPALPILLLSMASSSLSCSVTSFCRLPLRAPPLAHFSRLAFLSSLVKIHWRKPSNFHRFLWIFFFFSSLAERAITAVPVTALPYEAFVTSSKMPRFHQAETHKRTQNQQQPNKKPTTQHQPHPNRKPST